MIETPFSEGHRIYCVRRFISSGRERRVSVVGMAPGPLSLLRDMIISSGTRDSIGMGLLHCHKGWRNCCLAVGCLSLLFLLFPAVGQSQENVAPLPPEGAPLMTVSEVHRGQRAVAYTIFEGQQIEPFFGTVQGIARNYFGPQRHIILIRFEGNKVQHSGIVHGMSGSPVYIEGKLIGAISLALSPFPKDPLAGITPIAYMLDEALDGGPGPLRAQKHLIPTRNGWRDGGLDAQHTPARTLDLVGALPAHAFEGAAHRSAQNGGSFNKVRLASLQNLEPSATENPHGGYPLRPLPIPLLFSGVDPDIYEHFRPFFESLPVSTRLGTGGALDLRQPGVADVEAAAATVRPGGSVAAVLIEGDMSLTASGTVTYRDGNRIYAFGHPFLQQGPVSIPMASADVITTVADLTYPFKLVNTGLLVGEITHDRVTAVVGNIGPVPEMIPVQLNISVDGEKRTQFAFRLLEQRRLTPVLLQLALANAFKKQWRYFEEGTYTMTTTIRLKDRPPMVIRDLYAMAGTPTSSNMFDLIDDVAHPFAAIFENRFKPVVIEEIVVDLQASQSRNVFEIEAVYVDHARVRPGEVLDVKVLFNSWRGTRAVRTFRLAIPEGAQEGLMTIRVADALTLDTSLDAGGRPSPEMARDFEELMASVARDRRRDHCYLQLLEKRPGLAIRHQQLPALPLSVQRILQNTTNGDAALVLETAIVSEASVVLDGAVVGAQELSLWVLPNQ